jgi:YHS domain-containing protein
MIKLLIYFGLGYLVYKLFKALVFTKSQPLRNTRPQSVDQIDDIMVKDPFCETHFPKKDGVHLKISGEDLYFCSSECKEKYLAGRSTHNTHHE